MNEPAGNIVYEFGDFRVDLRKRQLCKNEDQVALTAKAFDTLAALLAADGKTLSKAKLMDAVWPETAVEENNLTQQISALRKAVGERAGDHKFIVTVPGRGYCFVANVRKIESEADQMAELHRSAEQAPRAIKDANAFGSNALIGYGLALAYILLICVPAFVVSWRAESRGVKPQSIAVLRFRSTGLGDELLGMGIRDTLRAKLGSLDDVTVRPVETDAADDVVDAGRQLNVDVVVTGSIQHTDHKIRVAVEMVDVSNQRIIWGNTFDDSFSNAFELQDSISSAVMYALKRPKLSGAVYGPHSPFSGLVAESFPSESMRNSFRPDDPDRGRLV